MTKTVLFIHGLESGPHGTKARLLASAGFTVVSELMPCGRAQLARDPLLIGAAVGVAAAVTASTVVAGWRGLLGSVAVAGAAAPFGASRVMRRAFRRSVGVQTQALAAHGIDVVVGSSFGGAVALALLLGGAWSGPTLLLCPAQELVARRAWLPEPPSLAALPSPISSHVVVVHGRADQVVPVSHSQTLVAGSPARLVLVDDGHRLSAAVSAEQFREWIAMAEGGAGA